MQARETATRGSTHTRTHTHTQTHAHTRSHTVMNDGKHMLRRERELSERESVCVSSAKNLLLGILVALRLIRRITSLYLQEMELYMITYIVSFFKIYYLYV